MYISNKRFKDKIAGFLLLLNFFAFSRSPLYIHVQVSIQDNLIHAFSMFEKAGGLDICSFKNLRLV